LAESKAGIMTAARSASLDDALFDGRGSDSNNEDSSSDAGFGSSSSSSRSSSMVGFEEVSVVEGQVEVGEVDVGEEKEEEEEGEGYFAGWTMNPHSNPLARGGVSSDDKAGVLDYVLHSAHHLAPKRAAIDVLNTMRAATEIKAGKKTFTDLSDHYPVMARFEF